MIINFVSEKFTLMTQHNYFTLTFMIRKARMSRSGEAPIFARLTISGQRAEFNINWKIQSGLLHTVKVYLKSGYKVMLYQSDGT